VGVHDYNTQVVYHAEELRPFAIALTKDFHSAADLCQETLYKAFAYRDHYQPGTNIKAWLCTIMRNIFINDYRRNARKKMVMDTVRYFESRSERPSDRLSLQEINKAVDQLPEIFKSSYLLYQQGYQYQEIADLLNQPLGTIKSRIHFAKKQLQKKLSR
jgi:RNA polymerase sigma factor (sigma-70 family)